MSKRRKPESPLVSRWTGFRVHALRRLLHGSTGLRVGLSPKRSSGWPSSAGRPSQEFSAKFVRRVGQRYSLIEKPGGDCIFWDKSAGCTVYPARPVQCRTWPFWPENVESPEEWEHRATVCPGSGQGRVYTVDEIVASISRHEDE